MATRKNKALPEVNFSDYGDTRYLHLGTPWVQGSMNIEKPFDIAQLAMAAGATYAARGTAYHANQLAAFIKKGIEHKGFSLIEAISTCPTYYGRKNKKGSAVAMINYLKESFVDIKAAEKLPPEKLVGKHIMGEFKCVEAPEYTSEYQKIIDRFKEAR